jgi:hypothetical protein
MKISFDFSMYFLFLCFLVSCKDGKKEFSINEQSLPTSELKKLAIIKGDTIAYHEMSIAYMDSPNDDKFIEIAKLMVSKHQFHEAYLDVYYCLVDYYHRNDYMNLDDLSPETQKSAINYLKEGAERGNKECKKILGKYYLQGKYIKLDNEKGEKLVKEGEAY